MNQLILNHYLRETRHTDPGKYHILYDAIPTDIEAICTTVNSLLIHPVNLSDYPEIEMNEREIWGKEPRTVLEMLERLSQKNENGLHQPRKPSEKLIVTCRGFSLLLTSILRYKGIPARARAGFAPYLNGNGKNLDHWVTEYWNQTENRWVLLDADKMVFDLSSDQFFFTADVFTAGLQDQIDIYSFGCDYWGAAYLTSYLNVDFLSLFYDEVWYNPRTPITEKIEWKEQTTFADVFQSLRAEEVHLLKIIGDLLRNPDENFAELQDYLHYPELLPLD